MDWANEPFRKAYDQSGSWFCLPVSARGLWRELQFYVDRYGSFRACNATLATALMKVMGAHRHEAKRFPVDLELLAKTGYVTIDDNRLTLVDPHAPKRRDSRHDDQEDIEAKAYRKLYRPCGSWLSLPLSARAVGKEMLFRVDGEGGFRIRRDREDGKYKLTAAQQVGYGLGMGPEERKRVVADLDWLLQDHFLVTSNDRLVVRNYVRAQARIGHAARAAAEVKKLEAEAAEATLRADLARQTASRHAQITEHVSNVLAIGIGSVNFSTSGDIVIHQPDRTEPHPLHALNMGPTSPPPGADLRPTSPPPGADLRPTSPPLNASESELTPRNHSPGYAKKSSLGREEGSKEENIYPESPEAPPGPVAPEVAPGMVVQNNHTQGQEAKEPEMVSVAALPGMFKTMFDQSMEQLEPRLMARAAATSTAAAETAVTGVISTIEAERLEREAADANKRADAAREAERDAKTDKYQKDHTRRTKETVKRHEKRAEAAKAQMVLFGEASPPEKLTVPGVFSQLEIGSGGVFHMEKVVGTLGGMLARQIKDLNDAGRTIDDVKCLAEYIKSQHLAAMPGGAPSVTYLSHVGVLHELIGEALRWHAAGRPLPHAWNRGRGPGRARADGYVPAATQAQIAADPCYQAGEIMPGGAIAINPWATDEEIAEGIARRKAAEQR